MFGSHFRSVVLSLLQPPWQSGSYHRAEIIPDRRDRDPPRAETVSVYEDVNWSFAVIVDHSVSLMKAEQQHCRLGKLQKTTRVPW